MEGAPGQKVGTREKGRGSLNATVTVKQTRLRGVRWHRRDWRPGRGAIRRTAACITV